jgi:hypothetical protein
VKTVKKVEENNVVVELADADETAEDVLPEIAEEVPLATAVMAATAAISAPMMGPTAKDSSSGATRLPPWVVSGKDSTVAFTSKPMSICATVGSVAEGAVSRVGRGLPISIKSPPPGVLPPLFAVLIVLAVVVVMVVGMLPWNTGKDGKPLASVPGNGIRLTIEAVPVPVLPEMGVSRVQSDPRPAGRGEGEMLAPSADGASVPMMEPSIVAPVQLGKQSAGPVRVPVISPDIVPEVGKLIASSAVKVPLKMPVTGMLPVPFCIQIAEMVPTKFPTILTDPGCWLLLVSTITPVRIPVMFPEIRELPG